MRDPLQTVRRLVIKAGTSILTSPRNGLFSNQSLKRLGAQILQLVDQKKEVVLVSSGAIACGMEACRMIKRPKEMPLLQACAAIGQGKLMHAYEKLFSKRGLHAAQLLLTRDGLETRKRFLMARQTLKTLLQMKDANGRMTVLPIINENDTVATDEIAFGDNDILAVHAAHLIHADILIILSDVDGFFLKDGSRLRQVSRQEEIDRDLVRHLRDKIKSKTVGGMKAKLSAARAAMRLGIPLLMVNGHKPDIVTQALAGKDVGTFFLAGDEPQGDRKKWIAFSAARRETVIAYRGAERAPRADSRRGAGGVL